MSDPLLGKGLLRYRLTRRLREGGMGAVYEAVHATLGGRMAVKVLRPELCQDRDAVDRFFAEARAASQVGHPGLVQIFDQGRLDDEEGTPALIMEYLAGETLRERLDRAGGRLEPGAVIEIGRQVAAALAAVHAAGIVHRDLTPANLLLVPDPAARGGERVKVVDFGVARLLDPGGVSGTTQGRFLGTPRYASPEQCDMAGPVSDRADVYALGVVLYEALAGQAPFPAQSLGRLISAHLTEAPPPLRGRAPEAPPALCALVHDMLAKDPRSGPRWRRSPRCSPGWTPRRRAGRARGRGPSPPACSCFSAGPWSSSAPGPARRRGPRRRRLRPGPRRLTWVGTCPISGSLPLPRSGPPRASAAPRPRICAPPSPPSTCAPRRSPICGPLRRAPPRHRGHRMMKSSASVPLLLPLLLLLAGGGARADEAPAEAFGSSTEQAQRAVERARAAFAEGRYDAALVDLQTAHALSGKPLYLFNIAQCHRRAGRPRQALDAYERFLREDPRSPLRRETEGYIAELRTLLGQQDLLARERRPVWRRPWFWGLVAGGLAASAVALGTGLALGLRDDREHFLFTF
jgi:serine/threonine protein kinase